MYKSKSILAVIPARGGSKRLPYKNIKPLLGKPLIGRTIEQAKKSKYLDKIIVSTDSPKIAKVARGYNAEVPFMRPRDLSGDEVPLFDVVVHALKFYEKKGICFDIAVILQPPCPFRTSKDIDDAVEFLFKKKAKAIISICEAFHHPMWMNILPPDGCLKDFLPRSVRGKNSQYLPKFFQLNGAIFLGFADYIKKHKSYYGRQTYAYIMPKERSIEIDDMTDFKLAEALLKR
ncbi:MAG: acylneuraminate cytidylyltransferase family protein [Candidatus Omnitrophota bacterium]